MHPKLALALAATITLLPVPISAQDGDGAYGRLDADTTLSIGIGGGVVREGESSAALVADLRARYLDTAGLVIAPEWHPDGGSRVVAAVDVRPLFPARFLIDGFTGVEVVDLTIESIGLELGAAFVPRDGGTGVALALGFGLDVPIVPPSVWERGLWLRFAARHVRGEQADRVGPAPAVSDWVLMAVLTVRGAVDLGIASREPPRHENE